MINRDGVKRIANLARIGLDEKEIEKFVADLSSILDWVEQLEEADVKGVLPTAHIAGMDNVSREDRIFDFIEKKKIVELFPENKNGYDKVKSVL